MNDADPIVSFGSPAAWLRAWHLAAGAIRRGRASIVLLTAVFTATGVAAAVLLPRTYAAESRVLAQRNYVMPALAHPTRAVPTGSEAPTQSAAEFVLNRGALEGIVRRTSLLDRWERERPAVMRLKDRVVQTFSEPISDEDKLDAIIDLLAKRITVSVNNDVITIKATWSNPRTTVDIVTGAVDAFLAARQKADVQTIADTYALLERTAAAGRMKVEAQLADVGRVERAVAAAPRPPRPLAPPVRTAAGSPAEGGSQGRDQWQELGSQIVDARQNIAEAEARRQAQVRELETQLAQSRAVQTDRHPDVIALERALVRLQEEPAELRAARAGEAQLLEQYLAAGGRLGPLSRPGQDPAVAAADPERAANQPLVWLERAAREEEDDALAYSRSILKNSVDTYQDILIRLANVQIELETAKAAFGYRYSVIDPARLPKKATAPNRALIVVGALLAGLFAGLLRALFNELGAQELLAPSALRRHLSVWAPVADIP